MSQYLNHHLLVLDQLLLTGVMLAVTDLFDKCFVDAVESEYVFAISFSLIMLIVFDYLIHIGIGVIFKLDI